MEIWEDVLVFHLSEVNQMSTRKSWGLTRKSKLSPPSDFAAWRQLHCIQKKVHKVYLRFALKGLRCGFALSTFAIFLILT